MEQPDSISRRDALIWTGTGAMALGGVAGGSVLMSNNAGATAEMQVEAPHLEVPTPDGNVENVVFYITIEASYSGFGGEVEFLSFETAIDGETVHTGMYGHDYPEQIGGDRDGESGEVWLHPSGEHEGRIFLFKDTSYEPADIRVPEDGESETFEFDIGVDFELLSADEEVLLAKHDSATATITIYNNDDDESDPEASMSMTTVELKVVLPNGESYKTV